MTENYPERISEECKTDRDLLIEKVIEEDNKRILQEEFDGFFTYYFYIFGKTYLLHETKDGEIKLVAHFKYYQGGFFSKGGYKVLRISSKELAIKFLKSKAAINFKEFVEPLKSEYLK